MGIADNGGPDQDEDAGPDDRPDAERGQIPGRQSLFQPMVGVICICEDLLDRFGLKKTADHCPSSVDGRRGCRLVQQFSFPIQ